MCLSLSSLKHLQKSGYNFNKCGAREAVLLQQLLRRYSIRRRCCSPFERGHTILTIHGTQWNLREPCYNVLLQSESLRELLENRSARRVQTQNKQIRLSGWWGKDTYIFISSMDGFDTKLRLSHFYYALLIWFCHHKSSKSLQIKYGNCNFLF